MSWQQEPVGCVVADSNGLPTELHAHESGSGSRDDAPQTQKSGSKICISGSLSEEARREEAKLQHRASQKQYMERRKARAREVEAQHTATAEELASLRLEHGALSSHHTALQQWQSTLEEMEGALQAAGPAVPAPGAAAAGGVLHNPTSASFDGAKEDEALLSGLPELPRGAIVMHPGYEDDPDDLERAVQALPEVLRAAALGAGDALVAEWRAHALELRECLARIDATGCPEAEARMKESMQRTGVAISLAMQHNPASVRALWQRSVPLPPPPGAGAEVVTWEEECRAVYHRAIAAVDARPEQLAAAVRMWGAFEERCAAASAAGADSLRRLQEMLLEAAHAQRTAAQGAHHLGAGAASEELRGAMREQYAAFLSLMHAANCVFSPIQKARFTAAIHPFFPDVIRTMRALAELEGFSCLSPPLGRK